MNSSEMMKSTDYSHASNNDVVNRDFVPSAPYLPSPVVENIPEVKEKRQTLSVFWLPLMILPWIVIFLLVVFSYYTLPEPILIENESSYPYRFIGERAKLLSQQLADIGPKVVGSEANVEAVFFLSSEISKIKSAANDIHLIEDEVQVSSGSFELGTLTTYYQGIQNVVVKISPRNRTTEHSLLINTHFDTVPGSPGGGDAGILVVVMLEVLRVLSRLPNTLQHAVVFLFNSSEEFELNGSHQFITQHPWARNVRALINMDSCGTGGREVLFQTTAFPWLMDYYKNTALHPTASVLGDELFKMGVIPSDTDFRIFRDFGNLRGLDFAIYRNGYIYHTKHDSPDLIPMSTFQNTGDNILALTRAVANADELGSPEHDEDDGDLVFFDIMGWFMISYSKTTALIINLVISVVSLVGIILSVISFGKSCGTGFLKTLSEFSLIAVIQLLSIALGIGFVILLAFAYDAGSRSMSWFSNSWLLFGIYFCPLFFCLGVGPSLYVMYRKTDVFRQSYFVQMFLHAHCFILVILTVALTAIGIRSTFIVVIAIIFYTLTTYINFATRLHLRDRLWIIVHAVGQAIPFMFYSYYTIFILDMFVPIQGRNGPVSNPENQLAMIIILFGILAGGFLIPMLYMFRRSVLLVFGFLLVFVAFGITMATTVGFPYRHAVSPRRFWIYHTQRTFHDYYGNVTNSDSGFYMRQMDRHYNDYLADYVPHMANAEKASTLCETEMMCALPSYQSMATLSTSELSHWIPSESPALPYRTTLILQNRITISPNVSRYNFLLIGPDHMALSISPLPGNEMIKWSFVDKTPMARNWGSRKLYFMMLIYGVDNSSISFYVDIEKSNDDVRSFDIAVVSHFTFHKELDTSEFVQFLNYFPDWAHVTSWTSAFDRWTF